MRLLLHWHILYFTSGKTVIRRAVSVGERKMICKASSGDYRNLPNLGVSKEFSIDTVH